LCHVHGHIPKSRFADYTQATEVKEKNVILEIALYDMVMI
jgi:hypothetical protein